MAEERGLLEQPVEKGIIPDLVQQMLEELGNKLAESLDSKLTHLISNWHLLKKEWIKDL